MFWLNVSNNFEKAFWGYNTHLELRQQFFYEFVYICIHIWLTVYAQTRVSWHRDLDLSWPKVRVNKLYVNIIGHQTLYIQL